MGKDDEYFPRGLGDCSEDVGSEGTFVKKKKRKTNSGKENGFADKKDPAELTVTSELAQDDLFSVTKQKGKSTLKRNKLSGQDFAHLANGHIQSKKDNFTVDTLTYETICEGILSLGKVVHVRDHELMVSLPGRTVGCVPITSISDSYTKALERMSAGKAAKEEVVHNLVGMFQPGQIVLVKVMTVVSVGVKHRIILSMKPGDLHEKLNSQLFYESMVYTAAVESQEDHGYIMTFEVNGIRAFLPNSATKAYIRKHNRGLPLGVGQLVQCKITQLKSHRLIANATLSANPREVSNQMIEEGVLTYQTVLPGMMSKTTVLNSHKTGVKVYFLDLGGLIHQDHMQDPWFNPLNNIMGSVVTSRVLYIMPNGNRPYLTLQPKLAPGTVPPTETNLELGDVYTVTIKRYEKRGLIIKFKSGEKGIVPPQRCSDDLSYREEDILSDFPPGSSHDCKLLEYSALDNIYIASFQKSLLETQDLVRINQVKLGETYLCKLVQWNRGGAVVALGKVSGFIPNHHFSHVSRAKYTPGSKFKARVFKIDISNSNLMLTTRKLLMKSTNPLIESFHTAAPGQISDGIIHEVKPVGVLVSTMGGLIGFVPASKCGMPPGQSTTDKFSQGELVKFQVVEVRPESNKLILTLGLSVEKCEQMPEKKCDKIVLEKRKRELDETCEQKPKKKCDNIIQEKRKRKLDETCTQKSEKNSEIKPVKISKQPKEMREKKAKKKCEQNSEKCEHKSEAKKEQTMDEVLTLDLPSSNGNFWEVSVLDDSMGNVESLSSDEENEESRKDIKEKKKDKKSTVKDKEMAIRARELELADSNRKPQSAEEFDCLVLGSPNSSLCWIQYMSFFLDSANVEMARTIGHKALKVIAFNEDQERLNVWVALLNLENSYGTEELVRETFHEASRNCDGFKISMQMAEIYEESDKINEAEKVLINMIKKYKTELSVWTRIGSLYYRSGKIEVGRQQFTRGLAALDKCHHIQLIVKYAQLEFKHGDEGRARTMMDQTLSSYPKRLDIWLTYTNLLIKYKDFTNARLVFLKAAELQFPPKKMRPLLKNFLTFETDHGDAESRARVAALAVEYAKNIDLKL